MSQIKAEAYRDFHGQGYQVKLQTQGDKLTLSLDQKFDFSTWNNTFTQAYVEDLSQKTGYKRKFTDFCLILSQAIKGENTGQISIDILTYQDLENMKAKKSGLPNPTQNQLNPVQLKANKRYIILSVATNTSQDKVHYPLTLNFEENNDVDKLKQTVRQLKLELDDVKSQRESFAASASQSGKGESFFITENMEKKMMNSTNSSIQTHQSEPLIQENEILKTKIKRLEDSFQQKVGALEVDSLMKSKLDLEIEMDTLKIQSTREIEKLRTDLEEKDFEIQRRKSEVIQLQKDLIEKLPTEDTTQRLKQHILKLSEESEKELISSRKTLHVLQKENEKFHTDIDFYKRSDIKQKNRIKQLEIELDTAIKRGSKISDRLYSPYNKTTTNAGRRANSVPVKSYSPSNRFGNKNAAQKPGYQRNTSNEANKSRLSPSYNYGYKKSPGAASTTNTRNYGANRNSNYGNNSRTSNYGQNNSNNNRTGAGGYNSNNRVSPGANRVSPGNNRVSPGNNRVSPGANRASNTNNRVSPGVNRASPGANRVSPGAQGRNYGNNASNRLYNGGNNNRVSPGNSNTNINKISNTSQSPGNRYQQPLQRNTRTNNQYGAKNQSPGNRYSQKQSPGTRYNNYMNQNKRPSQGPISQKNVQPQFNDQHLKGQQQQQQNKAANQNKDLDNRLDRLQNLLNKAKK